VPGALQSGLAQRRRMRSEPDDQVADDMPPASAW